MAEKNSNFAPPGAKQQDDDLYAQIAAADEEEQQKARAKSTFLMDLMITYMRVTLWVDSKRRQYRKLFRVLGGIWAILMMILYLLGLAMLLILIVSYMRFPTEIQKYLKENNIICEDMKIPGYIISQVELKGLHDQADTYRIDNLSISSTFADFLNRRARNVSAKGVRLTLDPDAKGNNNPLTLLSKLNQVEKGKSGLRIDSLKIENAVLTLKGKDYSLPVSLSLTGIYGNETNISSFITIDEPALKLSGNLTIRNASGGLKWDLSIVSGQITFPGRPAETLKGKLGFKTKQTDLNSISADLSILLNQARRDIKLTLDKKKGLFSGLLSLKWYDSVNTVKPVEKTRLDFNVSDVKLSASGALQTKSPVQMSLTTKYSSDFQISNLMGTFMGELSCQLFDTCTYRLDSPATLSAQKVSLKDRGSEITNKARFQFVLEPKAKLIDISFKTGRINFDLNSKNFLFNGEQAETNGDVILKVTDGKAVGYFNLWNKELASSVSMEDFAYQNSIIDLKQGKLLADNVFEDDGRLYLFSPSVVLKNNSKITLPFSLTYSRDKGISDIAVLIADKKAQILFGGIFDWTSGYMDGQLVIPTIDLATLKQPLHRVTDLVPAEFIKTSGKLSAYGRVFGNLYSELKGPIYLSLQDFGFETDTLKIRHANTALTIVSLDPFMTEPDQKIYIGEVETFIPISDVDITLKAEDNYAQLKGLTADVAGVRLSSGETVIPYRNIGTLLYLRNQDEDLTGVARMIQLKDWKSVGSVRGSILFPIEIKNMSLSIKNAILQLFGAELQYTGPAKSKPAFLDKNNKLSITSGTVTLDSDNTTGENKVSLLLDSVLLPSKLKKTIRETLSGKLTDLVKFKEEHTYRVPTELQSQMDHIQEVTDEFRLK